MEAVIIIAGCLEKFKATSDFTPYPEEAMDCHLDLIIEPRRGRNEQILPGLALMVVNPAEADQAIQLFSRHLGRSRSFNQSTILVDKDARLCLAGPALGAPAAALVMEKLIVLGVREIWLMSCCGSLDPGLTIGDVLLGGRGLCGEGVSRSYASAGLLSPVGSAEEHLHAFLMRQDIRPRRCDIWSTDAPYREKRSELIALRERYGISGVDMEYSALCAVAAFRGISFGGLFVVSDDLWRRRWKPGFSGSEFKNRCRVITEKLIDFGLNREERQ